MSVVSRYLAERFTGARRRDETSRRRDDRSFGRDRVGNLRWSISPS
jgi:hypothetical protein